MLDCSITCTGVLLVAIAKKAGEVFVRTNAV
jgi:hypothetical protein